jgi:hypothetical protein
MGPDDVKPMTRKSLFIFIPTILISMAIGIGIGMNIPPREGIPIRLVADYLHAILQSDRTFYTQHVVERMEDMLLVTATENWREDRTLPLPAQFLKEASRGLQVRGNPFRYRLISLWPLNPENAPQNDRERQALEKVVDFGEVAEQKVSIDGRNYYRAIFPDRAVSRSCITCHNAHKESPKRNFKLNDVMGGLEILIPLD